MRLIAIALAVSVPCFAAAQSSGGSFGSSDFGGGGSSGGGSSYGSSSGGGSSSSSSPEPERPPSAATFEIPGAELGTTFMATEPSEAERAAMSGGGDRFACAFCGTTPLFFLGLMALSWVLGTTAAQRRARVIARSQGPCEVRRVSIGFDWSVRRELQAALDRMASTMSLDGSEGRREGARAIAAQLQQALAGARFACFQSYRVRMNECEARFQTIASSLRSRFKRETAGERSHGAAPEVQARADEGQGMVVASIVVATDRWLEPLPATMDRAAIATALAQLGRIDAPKVFALEVVWSPSLEDDRLSSLELESFYPELQALDDVPRLGRVACEYCRAPYPAELARCPGCGAPKD